MIVKDTVLVETYTYRSGVTYSGLTFGNNAGEDDFACELKPGATLKINSGQLNYKSAGSSFMMAQNSTLNFVAKTKLYLYQNLNLNNQKLIFGRNTTLGRAAGKDIIGTIRPGGNMILVSL